MDGEQSIPTAIRISPHDLQKTIHPQLREIFSKLIHHEASNLRFSSHDDYQLRFNPNQLEDSLRLLCATERFVWTHYHGNNLRDHTILEFDDGGSWHFELFLTLKSKNRAVLIPQLTRQHADGTPEIKAVHEVVGVCTSGAILFDNKIGLACQQDAAIIQDWRRTKDQLEIPNKDLEDFLEWIYKSPAASSLRIDESLNIPTYQLTPKGQLFLKSSDCDKNSLLAAVNMKYDDCVIPYDGESGCFFSKTKKCIIERDVDAESSLVSALQGFAFQEKCDFMGHELTIHQKHFVGLIERLVG